MALTERIAGLLGYTLARDYLLGLRLSRTQVGVTFPGSEFVWTFDCWPTSEDFLVRVAHLRWPLILPIMLLATSPKGEEAMFG